jgi:hypothetical protein
LASYLASLAFFGLFGLIGPLWPYLASYLASYFGLLFGILFGLFGHYLASYLASFKEKKSLYDVEPGDHCFGRDPVATDDSILRQNAAETTGRRNQTETFFQASSEVGHLGQML